jgi:hypothetical protein
MTHPAQFPPLEAGFFKKIRTGGSPYSIVRRAFLERVGGTGLELFYDTIH